MLFVSVFVSSFAGLMCLVGSQDVLSTNERLAERLEKFESAAHEKEATFQLYTQALRKALGSRIDAIRVEVNATHAKLDTAKRDIRENSLQMGLLEPRISNRHLNDVVNIDRLLRGSANSLVECARAQRIYERTGYFSDHMKRLVAATEALTDALETHLKLSETRSYVGQQHMLSCARTVSAALQYISILHGELIESDRESSNATRALCIAGQNKLVTDVGWISADSVPVLEDILEMRRALQAETESTGQLEARLAVLEVELALKEARLSQLDRETTMHNALAKQRIDTITMLRQLMGMA